MNFREIDKLVAEKIFGYKVYCRHAEEDLIRIHESGGGISAEIEIPYYSTNINDAWLVIEKMNDQDFLCKQENWKNEHFVSFVKNENSYTYLAPISATSICMAALKAFRI